MLEVVQPGLLCTLQDRGRWGMQRLGIRVGGAMDPWALALNNAVLGNAADTAALEIASAPARFIALSDGVLAVTGAGADVFVDDRVLPRGEPRFVPAGSRLRCVPTRAGNWLYLGAAGGFAAERFDNGAGTDLLAGVGGFAGRALRAGDRLSANEGTSSHVFTLMESLRNDSRRAWFLAPELFACYENAGARVIAGPEWDWFTSASQSDFLNAEFTISPDSDRVGYRLVGQPLARQRAGELLSTAVCSGIIQVTSAGQPILLQADCQTTGGYPRIAKVIAADLPLCAQKRPRDALHFQMIELPQAEELLLQRAADLARVRAAVEARIAELC